MRVIGLTHGHNLMGMFHSIIASSQFHENVLGLRTSFSSLRGIRLEQVLNLHCQGGFLKIRKSESVVCLKSSPILHHLPGKPELFLVPEETAPRGR